MQKNLGIIGGMGPEATCVLFERIIKRTDAERDQDHINITILNDPSIPDRTAFLLKEEGAEDFTAPIKEKARQLEVSGCDVIAIPCSTSHVLLDDIRTAVDHAQILDMPKLAAVTAKKTGASRAGILATDGTVRFGLYEQALRAEGITAILPSPATQEKVMAVIYDHVKAGHPAPEDLLDDIFADLKAQGCDTAILGCTELSVIDLPESVKGICIIDALNSLAEGCVDACGAPSRTLL